MKGVGVMAGGYMPDGELLPDRYYARLQYGHLKVFETLEEAEAFYGDFLDLEARGRLDS